MIKAIRLWNNITRLPCAAHTLQLTVNYSLKKISSYTQKIKKLVHFFDSLKQQERLEKAQKMVMERDNLPLLNLIDNEFYSKEEEAGEINDGNSTDSEQLNISTASKTLRLIKDCPTRWNSTYRSWERLLKLKDAIIWLEANLKISRHSDDKKDGQNLACCLPNEVEWKLIEELIKIFEPFDQATEAFCAEKYPTLSVVYPIIEVLKSEFAADPNLTLVEEEEDSNEEYGNFLT